VLLVITSESSIQSPVMGIRVAIFSTCGASRPPGEGDVLPPEVDALLEADSPAVLGVEDSVTPLDQACLQHLEGVLEVQKDGRCASVIHAVVERPHSAPERGDPLGLEQRNPLFNFGRWSATAPGSHKSGSGRRTI
jgi:hypothetical protein